MTLRPDDGPQMAGRPLLFDPAQSRFVAGPGPAGGTFGVLDLSSRAFTVHRASDGSVAPMITMSV